MVIDTLAGELEVSAVPVREAIRRLEAEGLIVYRPNAGAQVAPAEPGLYDEELTVLAVLEGYATALAADEMRREDISRLEEINKRMATAMEHIDALSFGRLNQEFHAVIYDCCRTPRSSSSCATSGAGWTRSAEPSSSRSRTGGRRRSTSTAS